MESFAASFAPIFLRLTGLLFFVPVLGGRVFPARLKVMLAAVLALAAVGNMPAAAPQHLTDWQMALGLIGEFGFGAVMGLTLSLVFIAAQMAGQFISNQMGLNLAGSIDPSGASATSPLTQLYYLLAGFVFLLIDGHHLAIIGLGASFDRVPPMAAVIDASLAGATVGMLASATALALCIALPTCTALLVVDLALGMIGKTIPQISFMSVGMTLRAAAGLTVVILALGVTARVLGGAFTDAVRLAQGIGAAP